MKKVILSLALLGSLVFAQDQALIVGCCSEYENPRNGIPLLQGTQNDAKSILKILLSRGVKRSNIDYLVEHDATYKNITNKLKEKAKESSNLNKGDTLYVYYSGHGTSVGDHSTFGKKVISNKDILKRLNNSAAFIPYDFDLKNITKTMIITSRDFKPTFKALDNKGVKIVWIADACFAGNGYRSAGLDDVKGTNLNQKEKNRAKKEARRYANNKISYKHLTFFGATATDIVTQEVEYKGETRGEFSVEVEKCLNRSYGTKKITNKNLKDCLEKNFSPFVFSSAIYPINSRLDRQVVMKAPKDIKVQPKKQQKSFRERLFELESSKSSLKMNIYSTDKPSLAINRFCNKEELAIDLKKKTPYVMTFTMDKNGQIIMLIPNKDTKFNQNSAKIVKTVVQKPFGKDRVKVFTTNDSSLYQKVYNYRDRKEGILSGGDIESIYTALAKSKNFKTAHIEVNTISTHVTTCRKGD